LYYYFLKFPVNNLNKNFAHYFARITSILKKKGLTSRSSGVGAGAVREPANPMPNAAAAAT
jgi:hypothetical protein